METTTTTDGNEHTEDVQKIMNLHHKTIYPLCIERLCASLYSQQDDRICRCIGLYLKSSEANCPILAMGICAANGRIDLIVLIMDIVKKKRKFTYTEYFAMTFLFGNIHEEIVGSEEADTLREIFIEYVRDNIPDDVATRGLIIVSNSSTSGFYRLLEWFYDTPDKVPLKLSRVMTVPPSSEPLRDYRASELAYMISKGYGSFFTETKSSITEIAATDNDEEDEELERAIAESLALAQ